MTSLTTDHITVATYNVLADCFIRREFYPGVVSELWDPASRHPRLVQRMKGLEVDVLCLQEVERAFFVEVERALRPLEYQGRWAYKGAGKIQGCATFVRRPLTLVDTSMRVAINNHGTKPSIHTTLISTISCPRGEIDVANTHLQWDDPDAPAEQRHGLGQAERLAQFLAARKRPTVICGDFNAEPGSEHLARFLLLGFRDVHPFTVKTCNPRGYAKKVDYILYSPGFTAVPIQASLVQNSTILPSEIEPSDHIPLVASFF